MCVGEETPRTGTECGPIDRDTTEATAMAAMLPHFQERPSNSGMSDLQHK